ncbi:MAG: GNAT family N-acetyltransferase [Ruminococcaceae bacterium]|nr:GNAT family N-acetyltransferase [Oscillospiraceae bacterium]
MKEIKVYDSLPRDAMDIRIEVFVREQGFIDEEDENDRLATHFVMYDAGRAIATCRVFPTGDGTEYFFGRLAVLKEYRGQGLGSELLGAAEKHVAQNGGKRISLHSQYHAKPFYEFSGYTVCGEIEYEQNHPHVPMTKNL